MKYIIFSIIFASLMPVATVSAMQETTDPVYYVFNLTYDGQTLSKSNDLAPVPYTFAYDDVPQNGTNQGRVYSLGNKLLDQFSYSLQSGSNQIYVPFFSDAGSIQLLGQSGDIIYQYDISEIATCNRNNVCDSLRGENSRTCPSDCKGGETGEVTPPAGNTPGNSPVNSNAQPSSPSNDTGSSSDTFFNILIIAFFILGLATVVIFVIMFIRRNRN